MCVTFRIGSSANPFTDSHWVCKEKVTSGKKVDIEDFPFHVGIELDKKHGCSGAILSPTTVVTSAECVDGYVGGEI